MVNTTESTTEVLVVGGGTAGVCAAVQAARSGVRVTLVEEGPWLGGMLTAAGVSAVDGNTKLPSGLWGEFLDVLIRVYEDAKALRTGWVSHVCFEPHVGQQIFIDWVQHEPNLTCLTGYVPETIHLKDNRVTGVTFIRNGGQTLCVTATITIDATETGDVMASAGCDYRLGRDARDDTGEPQAPDTADPYIQDLTWVAILKDYGQDSAAAIPAPASYDPDAFVGTCRECTPNADPDLVDAQTMLAYGRLPNNKYMINWPIAGNDFYLNVIGMDRTRRRRALRKAKAFTLGYIHFLQSRLGWTHLALADDEFPTRDRLPLIPYHRESRRVKGTAFLTLSDLQDPYQDETRALYKTGIAVGDYPIDHHHQRCPVSIKETVPPIPAFTVPYGCMVPETIDGLLVTEKSLSVSHLANGCTRLQPVAMQLGQAAGTAAAWCVSHHCEPRAVPIRNVQQLLLNAGMWLMPFNDVSPHDLAFQAVQRVALSGVMRGRAISVGWANEMKFDPHEHIRQRQAWDHLTRAIGAENDIAPEGELSSRVLRWSVVNSWLHTVLSGRAMDSKGHNWNSSLIRVLQERLKTRSNPDRPLTRIQWAEVLDRLFDPFNSLPVTIRGGKQG